MAPINFAHFLSRLFFFNVEVAIVIIEVAIGQTKFGGHTVFSKKKWMFNFKITIIMIMKLQ